MKTLTLTLALFAALSTQCAAAAKSDSMAKFEQHLTHKEEKFAETLYWLPQTAKIFRANIPKVEHWVGFEVGYWNELGDAAQAEVFKDVATKMDAMEPAERQQIWDAIDSWELVSSHLDQLGFGDEFLGWAYEDELTRPAFDWILKRRGPDQGRATEAVAGTFASGELTLFHATLTQFLMKKTARERFRFYSRMYAKLADADS